MAQGTRISTQAPEVVGRQSTAPASGRRATGDGQRASHHRRRVLVAFAAVYSIWGSTFLAIRIALESFPPLMMAGARFVLAGAVLYLLSRARDGSRPSAAEWRAAAIIGALLFLGGNGALSWAIQYLPTSISALLSATGAFWLVLFDWLNRSTTRPRIQVIAGLILGLAGVALLTGVGSSEPIALVPTSVLMLGSICWAAGSVLSRRLSLPKASLRAAGMEMLAGGVFMLAAGMLFGEGERLGASPSSWVAMVAFFYLVFFGSIVGFSAYNWLLGAVSSARVSTYAYVNPLVAVFLGWAVLGERLTPRTLVAAGIIVAGVALLITLRAKAVIPGSEEIH